MRKGKTQNYLRKILYLWFILGAFLMQGFGSLCAQSYDPEPETWAASLEAISNQHFSVAESLLNHLTLYYPAYEKGWFNLGVVHERQGKAEAAYSAFKQVHQLNPQFPGIERYLGLMSLKMGQRNLARIHLRRSVDADSSRFESWFYLGSLYLESRIMDSAEWALEKALEINPEISGVWLEMARLKRRTGQLNAAARMLMHAKSNSARYFTELGHYFLESNRIDSAVVYFEKAFQLDPESPLHQLNFAAVLLQSNQNEVASVLLDSLAVLPNYKPLAKLNRSALALNEGRPNEAKEQLQGLLLEQPQNPAAWLNLGIAYEALFNLDSACWAWNKAFKSGAPKAEQYLKSRCDIP